jgi:hypothetical protein
MVDGCVRPVQHEQTSGVALGSRDLGDQLRREFVVKIGEPNALARLATIGCRLLTSDF